MKCGACKRDCRTTRLANVAEKDGGLRRARVCGKCFDGALHIIVSVVEVKKGADETKLARRDAKDATKGAVRKLRSTAEAYRKNASAASIGGDEAFADGRAAGLDQAADLLEAGDY